MSQKFPISAEERNKVLSLCVDFLGSTWTEVNIDDIDCTRLGTGFGNKSYHCSIKNCIQSKTEVDEHREVIVRVFESDLFNKSMIKFSGEMAEPIFMERLSKIGISPKVLGVFDKGIITEFIPNNVASVEELSSLELSKAVIRKIALFNSQNMPISKKPTLFDGIEKMAKITMNANVLKIYDSKDERDVKMIYDFDVIEELKWVRKVVPKFGHRIVFSHNDMNPNNILLKTKYTTNDDRVVLVDYECSTYFYRGYDIAAFLRFKNVNVTFDGNKIRVSFTESDAHTKQALLEEYLLQFKKLNANKVNPKYDNLETLKMEVDFFELVFDLFLVAFFKYSMNESKIQLPINLAVESAKTYKVRKDAVMKTYSYVFE